jgi:large subunit ribosomal protein L30
MLQKVKDYVTWGQVSADSIAILLRERGRLIGDKPVDDAAIAASTDHGDIASFAAAIASGDATMKDAADLKRVFRLHPPRGSKGWGGLKRAYTVGGALGHRGAAIEDLAARMM